MALKKLRDILLILIIFVVAYGLGYKSGSAKITVEGQTQNVEVVNTSEGKPYSVDFSLFWDVWRRLNADYVDKKALDPLKMVYGAIGGMVSSLEDPYTVFLPPEQNKEAKDDLGGKFEGIGAQLGVKDEKIIVIAPLKGSPAEDAGLRAGDWIVKVDGKETINWTLPETVSRIRGPKGSTVNLTVMKKEASSTAEVAIKRDEIKVSSTELELRQVLSCSGGKCTYAENECPSCSRVAYLKLSRFGDQTNSEWNDAVDRILEESKKGRIRGLVLDMRNNPGGYLAGSVFISSEFLSEGNIVTQESSKGDSQEYTVNRKGRLLDIPMTVLINKGSASASEIVAGALRDRGRAKLVGETSFGKGSIQEAQELTGGAGVHITVAKWLLPSGKWINGSGIEPDFKVEMDQANPDSDPQLDKAVELLISAN